MSKMFSKFIDLTNSPNPNLRSEQAKKWFRQKATQFRTLDTQKILSKSSEHARSQVKQGQMFLFAYDPKHKDTLPYWDRFPLVFPFRREPNGFYGINMHYLPVQLRARLMDSLYDNINNDAFDETTRIRMNYNILSSSAKFRYFKPCVKFYLNKQIDSRVYFIHPDEWEIAMFLPVHRFMKASSSVVHKDSRDRILKA